MMLFSFLPYNFLTSPLKSLRIFSIFMLLPFLSRDLLLSLVSLLGEIQICEVAEQFMDCLNWLAPITPMPDSSTNFLAVRSRNPRLN